MNKGSNCTVDPVRDTRDINRIKELLQDHPRDLALFTVGINVGLRGSDLLRLRWADVLDEDGQIVTHIRVQETKTSRQREIPVGPRLRRTLQDWLAVGVAAKAVRPRNAATLNNLLFPNPKGEAMSIQHLHGLVNKWCRRAKLKGNFGSHTLRKSFGYHLRMQGVALPLLMDIFGHSNPSMTRRYLGITKDEITEACTRLNL